MLISDFLCTSDAGFTKIKKKGTEQWNISIPWYQHELQKGLAWGRQKIASKHAFLYEYFKWPEAK